MDKDTKIIYDNNLRRVKFKDGRVGYAAMTNDGLLQLFNMECNGHLRHFKVTRLSDGCPFLAIQLDS